MQEDVGRRGFSLEKQVGAQKSTYSRLYPGQHYGIGQCEGTSFYVLVSRDPFPLPPFLVHLWAGLAGDETLGCWLWQERGLQLQSIPRL